MDSQSIKLPDCMTRCMHAMPCVESIDWLVGCRGVDPYGTGGDTSPQYLDWGDIITNVPPPIFLG